MRLPDPSPVLDEIRASRIFIQHWGWGLEQGSSPFPDSSSALEKFQSTIDILLATNSIDGIEKPFLSPSLYTASLLGQCDWVTGNTGRSIT